MDKLVDLGRISLGTTYILLFRSHVPAKMRNATDYFIELFEDVEVGSIMPCYDTLFDLPFYYVGV